MHNRISCPWVTLLQMHISQESQREIGECQGLLSSIITVWQKLPADKLVCCGRKSPHTSSTGLWWGELSSKPCTTLAATDWPASATTSYLCCNIKYTVSVIEKFPFHLRWTVWLRTFPFRCVCVAFMLHNVVCTFKFSLRSVLRSVTVFAEAVSMIATIGLRR